MDLETSPYHKLRVPFGEKEGRLYRPEDVTRGLECGCHCPEPECKARLMVKRSVAGRLFFAHHRSENCLGGYETALHKMGKQIILDAFRVWLPEREVTLSVPLIDGESLTETLHFHSREVEFVSAVSERKLENGFTPDVTAHLKNEALLHIEILVTHAVEEEKGSAVDNVMEIDLSGLSEETVLDRNALKLEVLEKARRWWHRCSLIDELPRVQTAKAALEARVPGEIKRIERKKAAKREKERKERLKVEKREAQARKRELERAPWLNALKKMKYAEDFTGWLNMADAMTKRAKPQLDSIAERLGFDSDKWPSFLDISLDQEWVFKEDRRLWQSAIFEQFIVAKNAGDVFSVPQSLQVAENAAGVRSWALQLNRLKQDHFRQPYNQKKSYKFRRVWFLEPDENKAIRSPYAVVLSYLRSLSRQGLLAEVESAKTFQVLMSDTDIWEAHRRKQTVPGLKRRGNSAHVFSQLTQQVSAESLQKAEERKQRLQELERQIERSVLDAESIVAAGLESAIFCKSCKRHHLPDAADCPHCRSYQIKTVALTESYMASLHARLRCMP